MKITADSINFIFNLSLYEEKILKNKNGKRKLVSPEIYPKSKMSTDLTSIVKVKTMNQKSAHSSLTVLSERINTGKMARNKSLDGLKSNPPRGI